MITILKAPHAPVFAVITRDPSKSKITPVVQPTPVGSIISECLTRLCVDYAYLRILNRIVMPDHIHFELFVTERTPLHLGSLIGAFKSACTQRYRDVFHLADCDAEAESPLFVDGFNDKIAVRDGAKDAFYNYIADNPRRYLVKKLCPEYFFHKLQIEINGRLCGIYGNLFLLDNPVKSAVRISRIPERTIDYEAKKAEWEETIRSGGVLVSPFINPHEKVYRNAAIENGNGVILVTDYRFSDRQKPYKELFDQCAEGRLLIISTEQFAAPPQKMEYLHAQELNAIAAKIADLPPCTATFRRRTVDE